jgi:hypothetical protein
MQTFLPVPTTDYSKSAKVLDNLRLNKQALEGWQILMNLLALDPEGNHREPKGWSNHPAVKMWRGHEAALLKYIIAMVEEWKSRGYKSTIADKAVATFNTASGLNLTYDQYKHISTDHPTWVVDPEIAATHRLALLTKNYKWYSQYEWEEDTGVPPLEYEYIWPVK